MPTSISQQTVGLASAPHFSAVYSFGDSLSDAGNVSTASAGLIPFSPPYSDGRFSNGPVWVQDLATDLGLPPVKASLQGGTDYAYGSAYSGTTPGHSAGPLDLDSQVTQFDQNVGAAPADALYTVSAGANDLLDVLQTPVNPTLVNNTIIDAVLNVDSFVYSMAARGAHSFAVLDVPDLGKVPGVLARGPVDAFLGSFVSAVFDQILAQTLSTIETQSGLAIDFVDSYGLIDSAVQNPAAFGLANVTTPVWTGNYEDPTSGRLNATGAAQNTYLFFDSLHPTATGHAYLAADAYQGLTNA